MSFYSPTEPGAPVSTRDTSHGPRWSSTDLAVHHRMKPAFPHRFICSYAPPASSPCLAVSTRNTSHSPGWPSIDLAVHIRIKPAHLHRPLCRPPINHLLSISITPRPTRAHHKLVYPSLLSPSNAPRPARTPRTRLSPHDPHNTQRNRLLEGKALTARPAPCQTSSASLPFAAPREVRLNSTSPTTWLRSQNHGRYANHRRPPPTSILGQVRPPCLLLAESLLLNLKAQPLSSQAFATLTV